MAARRTDEEQRRVMKKEEETETEKEKEKEKENEVNKIRKKQNETKD